jgi:hypothetical protein
MREFRKTDNRYFGVYFPTGYKRCIIQAIHVFVFYFCIGPNPWLCIFPIFYILFFYTAPFTFIFYLFIYFFFGGTRLHFLHEANVLDRVLRMSSFVQQKIFLDSLNCSTPYEGRTAEIESHVAALLR